MIIPCFRCGKEIDTPNSSNADYIIAQDTISREPREVLVSLVHNRQTLAKQARMKEIETYFDEDGVTELTKCKYLNLKIEESEYDTIEVPDIKSAQQSFGEDLVKVVAEIQDKDIQKTGIICPNCHRKTDVVIWGVHKET